MVSWTGVMWAIIAREATVHFLSGACVGLGAYYLTSWITRKARFDVALSRGSACSNTASLSIGGLRWAAALFALSLAHLLLDGML